MTFIPTITRKAEGHAKSFLQNQMGTTMITGAPDDKAIALVAKLRLNCCKRILDKIEDKASPAGIVFASIIMEAKTILQALK